MSGTSVNPFDRSAAQWDSEPRRFELVRAVGEAILRRVSPTPDTDVLDYGCGTGLLGLFLLPRVRSVMGADSSPGMIEVLDDKIREGDIRGMRTMRLDLEHDRVPDDRFHLIAANMVLHHVARIDGLLEAFHRMLLPGGVVALADLDAEPGVFHHPESRDNVYHHGFDRRELAYRLRHVGFDNTEDTTAHVIRKPITTGEMREFPVFLIVASRA